MAALVSLLPLAGCTFLQDTFAGDKVDYRTNTTRATGLDVPPDLDATRQGNRATSNPTARSARRASRPRRRRRRWPRAGHEHGRERGAHGRPAPAAGNFHIERLGNERWLSTSLPPEEVYPQVRAFWKDKRLQPHRRPRRCRRDGNGLGREPRQAARRPHPQQPWARSSTALYSTGELDKYRTRIERTATGSDIFVTHRGMVEVYAGQRQESTVWQPRPRRSRPGSRIPFTDHGQAGRQGTSRPRPSSHRATRRPSRRSAHASSTGAPARRSRSTTASTAPGAESGSPSTAAASTVEDRDRTQRGCTSSATSIRSSRAATSRTSSRASSRAARTTKATP